MPHPISSAAPGVPHIDLILRRHCFRRFGRVIDVDWVEEAWCSW